MERVLRLVQLIMMGSEHHDHAAAVDKKGHPLGSGIWDLGSVREHWHCGQLALVGDQILPIYRLVVDLIGRKDHHVLLVVGP